MSNQQQQPEEIDILSFFNAIGNLFKNLFKGLINIFKNIFYLVLDVLLYLKKHYIYLGIGILTGLVFAFISTNKKNNTYYVKSNIRANYNAQLALQEKFDGFNTLIKKKMFKKLAGILQMDTTQAKHFLSFELEPVYNDVLLMEDYEDFLMHKDTVIYKFLEFDDYKKSLMRNPELNKYWSLTIKSDDPSVFKNMREVFKRFIENDPGIQYRKNTYLSALNKKKEEINKTFENIDSMRKVFDHVMLELARNQHNSASNIVVSSDKVRGPESPYNLFSERRINAKELENLSLKLNKYNDAIIFLNNFPAYGIKEYSILSNSFIKYSLMGFLFVLMILLMIDFNKYLKDYQHKKEQQTA